MSNTYNFNNFCVLNKEKIQKNLYYEWLVGNGLGSYSSGTVSGILNKRYHGIFVLSKSPPLQRVLLVSKIEESIEIEGNLYLLSANKWLNSYEIIPKGFIHLECFYLQENIPVWIYNCNETYIEKKIFMPREVNSVYITYKIISSKSKLPVKLKCNIFANNRDFHSLSKKSINIYSKKNLNFIELYSQQEESLFHISTDFNESNIENITYFQYELQEEKNRGYDFVENHILVASTTTNLFLNAQNTIIISSENKKEHQNTDSIERCLKLENKTIIDNWNKENIYTPKWLKQILYAVNVFIVKRSNSQSIIAGYHWFGDWGRDTMISLPGLCCSVGQTNIAKSILENYANYVNNGMLPNCFPDNDQDISYNTVDAALWFIEAVSNYYSETNDFLFLKKIYPILNEIIDYYINGTRFKIKCDMKDGLLYAGESGNQLTWMDAKIGDLVVTPRIGKPIEINALWYNALKNMQLFSDILNENSKKFEKIYRITEKGFLRFWNEEQGYCYDVLDSITGNDLTLRPNQIFALSLKYCPLSQFQKRSIIDICGRYLVSYFGVRTLAKHSEFYKGNYIGSQLERDQAYHQGTIWSWLLGNYAIAYYNVTKNASVAIGFLEPLEKHINDAGIGFISEIFDAEEPFLPRGCIAQAWSVAETIRAWRFLSLKLKFNTI